MKGNVYTLLYAFVLGTTCALLLTAASQFTTPYRDANAKAEEVLNILTALKVPFEEGASSEELLNVFNGNIEEKQRGDMTIYEYSPANGNGEVLAVVMRFAGPGLWGPVKGFLALESDLRTIRGLTFYEQEETPGLGGEIVTDDFRSQFAGKSIVDESNKAGIVIRGGGNKLINGVDAISGATMTCDKVQQMLNKAIVKIVENE
ncbi:MAG: FMN-binding protein [Sedimentisphaerales bacterium]|nr:FMN-binding protein [Sedimentisphaerales bacterium]